jgi:hypothetical protein
MRHQGRPSATATRAQLQNLRFREPLAALGSPVPTGLVNWWHLRAAHPITAGEESNNRRRA